MKRLGTELDPCRFKWWIRIRILTNLNPRTEQRMLLVFYCPGRPWYQIAVRAGANVFPALILWEMDRSSWHSPRLLIKEGSVIHTTFGQINRTGHYWYPSKGKGWPIKGYQTTTSGRLVLLMSCFSRLNNIDLVCRSNKICIGPGSYFSSHYGSRSGSYISAYLKSGLFKTFLDKIRYSTILNLRKHDFMK